RRSDSINPLTLLATRHTIGSREATTRLAGNPSKSLRQPRSCAMRHRSKLWLVAPMTAFALALAGCTSPAPTPEDTSTAAPEVGDQGDIAALVKAAKAEGTVTWLTAMPQGFATA